MKFRCDCGLQSIDIILEGGKLTTLSFAIFKTHSDITGKKYKKPKLEADIVVLNNKYPKELDKTIKFLYRMSRNYLEKRGKK